MVGIMLGYGLHNDGCPLAQGWRIVGAMLVDIMFGERVGLWLAHGWVIVGNRFGGSCSNADLWLRT